MSDAIGDAIGSLWPDVIRASVQSPQSILLAQAEALGKQTNGVIFGEVKSGFAEDDLALLYFSIVVPDLDNYRHRIMVIQHKKDMLYPAWVDAEVFRANGMHEAMKAISMSFAIFGGESKKPGNRADTDTELIAIVGKVLSSPYVVSVAQSLIARVSDVRSGKRVEPIAPPAPSGATFDISDDAGGGA